MVTSLSQLVAGGSALQSSQNTQSRIASLLTAAASGNRITRAMDDIASLSAATSLQSEVSGLRSAALNVNQASSFLEVADGGLDQMQMMLDRLAQLATQANSGAISDSARRAINNEFQSIVDEIDRVATSTNFNGTALLDGSLASATQLRFDEALEAGDVRATGEVSDALVAANDAQAAAVRLQFAAAADVAANDTISITDGDGGAVDFTFVSGTPTAADEIQIGSTLEQTLENAAAAINAFVGANDGGVSQLNARIEDGTLVLESQEAGNVTGSDGLTAVSVSSTTAATQSNAALDNGAVGGVDVRNVTAQGFVGKIQGFESDFAGNDRVNLSVRIGEDTFRATVVATNSTTDNTVTFQSENGGSFNITLAARQGQEVRDLQQADQFGERLEAALSSINFTQNREVTNFSGAGDLAGASVSVEDSSFEGIRFARAAVLNGRLEVEIGGTTYRSNDLGDAIGAAERITLESDTGAGAITFVNGQNRFDISSDAGQSRFTDTLSEAFGLGDSTGGGAAFQVSGDSDGSVRIGIGDFTAQGLSLEGLNLLSAGSSAEAFSAVGVAIQTLTSQRADVGAFQQALDFAGNSIASAVQNQEAARSELTDTDIAAISSELSLLEAAMQASINTQAQTNRLQVNLLKLVQ